MPIMTRTLEICCDNITSVSRANEAGAHRIELCSCLNNGGISPSTAFTEICLKSSNIPINVLIRPRSGDFTYSNTEFEIMCKEIESMKSIGANGIVSGILTNDAEIDIEKTKILLEIAKPLDFTFHRAIDFCKNIEVEIAKLINIGVGRVLTSGGKSNIDLGLEQIISLHEKYRDQIIIMPGGGLNNNNIIILKKSGIKEFHSSTSSFEKTTFPYLIQPKDMGHAALDGSIGINIADKNKIKDFLGFIF
jgi:copper homeostasis protein